MNQAAPRIDVDLVRRLIAAQFPQWAHLPVTPVSPGGWDNRTFHLGDSLSARLPSAPRYAEKVAIEQHWLPKLGPELPLPIPVPVALGEPDEDFPWKWSVYQWIEGENATLNRISDVNRFATELARFLTNLQRIDPVGGPAPGPHNFFRGGPLATYHEETRQALAALPRIIDTELASKLWDRALQTSWERSPVWLHGDMSPANLLVRKGRLAAVIDFGGMAVGDPACDLAIAWTFFSGESRETFRDALSLDAATWARGAAWALWKSLITLAGHLEEVTPERGAESRRVLDEIAADLHTFSSP